VRKFSLQDYRRMPWKNGSGVTTQLAIWPEDADLDSFEWRISTAEIAKSGPFSPFAGYDRSLAVLRGTGVLLVRGESRPAILTPKHPPLRFDGELQPHAALLEGPVTDLNVISCRKRWSHTLERLSPGSMQRCEISATCMFVYCTGSHPVQVSLPSEETIECAEGESVMVDGGKNSHVIIDSPSPSLVYLARLTEQGNRHAE
jgi:hypothetical protein